MLGVSGKTMEEMLEEQLKLENEKMNKISVRHKLGFLSAEYARVTFLPNPTRITFSFCFYELCVHMTITLITGRSA